MKLIVCDMDGTLLNSQKQLPKGMEELISQLYDENILFAVASGRQYYSIINRFEKNKKHMFFIADNGCMVVNGEKNEVVASHIMDKQRVNMLVKTARKIPNAHVVLSGVKSAYYETDNKQAISHFEEYYAYRQQVDDLLLVDDDIMKISILDLEGTAEHVYPLYRDYMDELNIAVSCFEWMDIMAKGIHKGIAVCDLQQRLHISEAETMVFGDFMNDYEMLQTAYYSFAMKNAISEIKAICRFETEYSNDEEGVYREILKWKEKNWQIPVQNIS